MAGWLMLPAMGDEPRDRDLMMQYRNGDIAAFESLYNRHKGPLYRYLLRCSGHPDLTAELFQDVWTKIVRSKDQYQPAAKFTTYMYTVAHNCLVDSNRRRGRQPQHGTAVTSDDPDEIAAPASGNPENEVSRAQKVMRFRTALTGLPADQRDAFILREEAGLSLADIARVTGVTTETAKSRLRYAVRKLRQILAAGEDES